MASVATISDAQPSKLVSPSFKQALCYWAYLGWTSFGGPAAQISLMHRELVERRAWIDEGRFLTGLNLCMLLPGPEAQQLAVYLGNQLHGRRGGLVAGLLFILPSILILYGLAALYVLHGSTREFTSVLGGLQPVVVAIVAASAGKLATRVLDRWFLRLIALITLLALSGFGVSFPLLLLFAAIVGVAVGRWRPDWLGGLPGSEALATVAQPRWSWLTLGIGLMMWWLPIGLVAWFLGPNDMLVELGGGFRQSRCYHVWWRLCCTSLCCSRACQYLSLAVT